jgi:hypothetical protein
MFALPAAPPSVTIVSRSVVVEPGKVTGLKVSCPRGTVAASAGVSHALSDVDTLRSQPAGPRGWQFRFLSPEGDKRGSVSVSAVCLNGHARTVSRVVSSRERVTVEFFCPARSNATGFGWSHGIPEDAFTGHLGWILRRVSLGDSVVASDLASDARSPSGPLRLFWRCVPEVWRHLEQIAFAATVRPGENVLFRKCGGNFRAIGGGFELPGTGFFDGFAVTSPKAGRWSIYSADSGPRKVMIPLLCLSPKVLPVPARRRALLPLVLRPEPARAVRILRRL